MSAKHALLGLLRTKPAYPYELADRLQARLGPAFAINSGQLYQTIKRLELDGQIEPVDGHPGRQADRHVFAITPGGEEEWTRWFESEPEGARLFRRPLMVKISLADPDHFTDALQQIEGYENDCIDRLNELLARWDEAVPVEGLGVRAEQVLLRLGLSGDVIQLRGELEWAKLARETVASLLEREAVWPSAHASSELREAARSRDARERLFGRMAARHLASAPRHGRTGRRE